MILTLNEFDNDRDCPELYQAFNTIEGAELSTTLSDDPKDADHMDAPTYSYFLAHGYTEV